MHRLCLIPLLTLTHAFAADPAPRLDARAAFERLKTTAGTWQAQSSMGPANIQVEVLAGGSAILQREKMGRMEEMITMIHLDGDRLLLTHYCMVGNQPRMQARSYDAASGKLRFEFLDATNLAKPSAGHMHNATFQFLADGHVRQDWDFYENGKRTNTESVDYHRVAPAKPAAIVQNHTH